MTSGTFKYLQVMTITKVSDFTLYKSAFLTERHASCCLHMRLSLNPVLLNFVLSYKLLSCSYDRLL